jgi:hypothetical protein
VINASVISAVRGHSGDYHLTAKTRGNRLWISPLMPLYWFFDLPAVARRNLFLPALRNSESFIDAHRAWGAWQQTRPRRPAAQVTLP